MVLSCFTLTCMLRKFCSRLKYKCCLRKKYLIVKHIDENFMKSIFKFLSVKANEMLQYMYIIQILFINIRQHSANIYCSKSIIETLKKGVKYV